MRRAEAMGTSGLTDAELTTLVPDIDIEQDEVSMQLLYPIVRLWDQSFDALLTTLPPLCLGLSLFGFRPADVSIEETVRRGGWALRKVPASYRTEAAALFAELAGVHLDPTVARKILEGLKLL